MLKTKLAAGAMRIRRYNIGAEIIAAGSQSRLAAIERFADLGIDIVARIVSFVTHGDEQVIANHEEPAVILAVINLPLDGRHQRRRVGAWLNVAIDVQAHFNSA